MKLYKIESSNFKTFFGSLFGDDGLLTDPIERDAKIIAQTPNCDAFLFLSNTTYNDDNVDLLDTAPSGFDFTYCQEWGLEVNDAVVDRVIEDLS